jgi:hypothetical protein
LEEHRHVEDLQQLVQDVHSSELGSIATGRRATFADRVVAPVFGDDHNIHPANVTVPQ